MAAGLPDASTASAAMPNNDAASESDGNDNDPDDVNDNEDEIDYTKVFISEDLTRNRQFIYPMESQTRQEETHYPRLLDHRWPDPFKGQHQ